MHFTQTLKHPMDKVRPFHQTLSGNFMEGETIGHTCEMALALRLGRVGFSRTASWQHRGRTPDING
jgi:hypothetical protein